MYLVNLDQRGIEAQLKSDYYQRPITRLSLKVDPRQTVQQVTEAAIAILQAAKTENKTQDAIVELRLQGTIGFDRSALNVKELRYQLQELGGALIMLIKCEVHGVEYQTYISDLEEVPARSEIEKIVFTDLLAAISQYRDQPELAAQGFIDLKDRLLQLQPADQLYQVAEGLLSSLTPDLPPQD